MSKNDYWIPHREPRREFEIEDQQAFVALLTQMWHKRTGHISAERLAELTKTAVGIETKKDK